MLIGVYQTILELNGKPNLKKKEKRIKYIFEIANKYFNLSTYEVGDFNSDKIAKLAFCMSSRDLGSVLDVLQDFHKFIANNDSFGVLEFSFLSFNFDDFYFTYKEKIKINTSGELTELNNYTISHPFNIVTVVLS
jgi:uncharacterized protein YlxP (DUF503 family)